MKHGGQQAAGVALRRATHLIQEVQAIRVQGDDNVVRERVHALRELVLAHVEEAGAVQRMCAHAVNVLHLQSIRLHVQARLTVRQYSLSPLLQVQQRQRAIVASVIQWLRVEQLSVTSELRGRESA